MKLVDCLSALNSLGSFYTIGCTKVVVPVLFLLCVALRLILRYILSLALRSVLVVLVILALQSPRLGKRELISFNFLSVSGIICVL